MADMNMQIFSTNINNIDGSGTSPKVKESENNISVFGYEIDEDTLSTILTGTIDAILSDETFTKDEAAIYVAGELEISELIKNSKGKQSFIDSILDPNKIEREIRENYAKEHPEYASVMKEGEKVQSDFDKAKEEIKQKWIEDNPEPSDIMKKGGLFGITMTDEYRDWLKNKDNYLNNFEQEYIQNNPNYANLKEAQDKNKSLINILFGF